MVAERKPDATLRDAADIIESYPNGGSITGHTDDVADEAYNQPLSEKRAQSMHKRLGELTDLGKWQVSAVGKGEIEPRVKDTTEAARAINRRVDLVITPTGGTTTSSSSPTRTPLCQPPRERLALAQRAWSLSHRGLSVLGPVDTLQPGIGLTLVSGGGERWCLVVRW
ncbi:OmpA family protein [Actinomyces trachealis]|uniref:OmpA family protein n=1 Tax=Actinomyces trachealis TaxID=2763540 RepID=UPI002E2960E9|nr:OmpA family protein [Actinomyces trachealis]